VEIKVGERSADAVIVGWDEMGQLFPFHSPNAQMPAGDAKERASWELSALVKLSFSLVNQPENHFCA